MGAGSRRAVSATGALTSLLAPIQLGPVQLRNRVVSTSHQTSLVHDHLPTDDLIAYHEARARGGTGAIFIEATATDPTGLLTAHTIAGFLPQVVPAYRRLADAVHAHDTKLFVQFNHGGREQISASPRAPTAAPSAIPSLRFKTEPRALTHTEISRLIEGYAVSTDHAAQGGLDGVELSISHGYLPAQFLSRQSNRRGDCWDGPMKARMRFAKEVLTAMHDAVGTRGMAVGARLSADELTPGGMTIQDCIEAVLDLHEHGLLDFVSLVLGHSAYPAASTWIAPPPPTPAAAIALPAAAVRAALPGSLPVLATTRVVDLAAADRLISDGVADLVGLTRALIADPELVAKTLAGQTDEVIECIGCNQACIGHYHAGVPIGCAVNARTGRELTLGATNHHTIPHASGRARRLLVIGAGPAGAAAAIEAARAGDKVTLVEREAEIGGQLRLAGLAPAHTELWERYLRSTTARLRAAEVTLRLDTEADAELAGGYDAVVLATGARPYLPTVPATDLEIVPAWDAIRSPQDVAGPVLVADWGGGWDGLDAAERLAGAGREVTLACAGVVPGETLHQYQRNLYLGRLDEQHITILHHSELALDTDALALRHVFSGARRPLPDTATLVLAQGRAPADELWAALESHPSAARVGDVLGPRTLEEAVLEGTRAILEPSTNGAAAEVG
ncbi:MAG TPA: FAD-dependent oxidoreductase [Solirubrobacteraceae bacterium]|jgi:2,4-dienoyl-CoA reductase-like NADH-dependent reductase (Old Yellow Enzyme family)|nr:FAD-dependent oxidoreductase [Solirubrobacteraceae bacterium]